MTLHVKTTATIYGTIVVPKYVIPDEVWVKNGGSYCQGKEVWVKDGGTYCKVWPTPQDIVMSAVSSKTMDGFHWMGAPHAYAGAAEKYTVTITVGGRVVPNPYVGRATMVVGGTPITDPGAGIVIIEAQKKGSSRWTEVGRTMITGTEPRGLVTVNGVWPSSTGDYNFRARFVTADSDHYNSATGPSRNAGSNQYITVERRPAGTPAGSTVRITEIDGAGGTRWLSPTLHTIGTRATVRGSVRGATGGTVQVQWKLESESNTKWTNLGSARHITGTSFAVPVTFGRGQAGSVDVRVVYNPDQAGAANAISLSKIAGTFVPGKPGGVHATSKGSTSVAFSWNAVANANGYGVYGPSVGDRITKRTTSRNSGNMRLSSGHGTFYVKAYATDRTGHRWYGMPSTAYSYTGSTKRWSTFPYGYDYFHKQPTNP